MRINKLVAQIISAPNFDSFSSVEVRAAYLTLHDDKTISANDARKFIYRDLIKLTNKGWLKKSVSRKTNTATFVKTMRFDASSINTAEVVEGKEDTSDKADYSNSINQELFNRLASYKERLLIGLGESEEYKSLCTKFPELLSELQPQYNEVRERNSKLLGNIKALEKLISNKQ